MTTLGLHSVDVLGLILIAALAALHLEDLVRRFWR